MLTVEDGQGRADAESYASAETLAKYAASVGRTFDPPDDARVEAALRVASRYIDGTYRSSFSGQRVHQRKQALEWPRYNAFAGNDTVAADEIPRELVEAVCEAALRELVKPGILNPDTREGGAIRSVGAGGASVEFSGGGYTGRSTFSAISMAIAPLLAQMTMLVGKSGRA